MGGCRELKRYSYYSIDFAVKNNIPVILNPAPADPNLDINYVCKCDFFMPNETELEILTGLPVSNIDEILIAANSLISKGLKNLVVTLGEKGAIWLDGNVIHHIVPHKVNAIDTSGAGDAFIGCFAHYLVKTHDILSSLNMASAFSAYSVTGQGTQISYPDKKEFECFLGKL